MRDLIIKCVEEARPKSNLPAGITREIDEALRRKMKLFSDHVMARRDLLKDKLTGFRIDRDDRHSPLVSKQLQDTLLLAYDRILSYIVYDHAIHQLECKNRMHLSVDTARMMRGAFITPCEVAIAEAPEMVAYTKDRSFAEGKDPVTLLLGSMIGEAMRTGRDMDATANIIGDYTRFITHEAVSHADRLALTRTNAIGF